MSGIVPVLLLIAQVQSCLDSHTFFIARQHTAADARY